MNSGQQTRDKIFSQIPVDEELTGKNALKQRCQTNY